MSSDNIPKYDQLPIDASYPPHTAWGLWREDDNYGTLNLLTEERVLNASKCIRRGAIFPLNWKLESPQPVLFGRPEIEHTQIPHNEHNLAFDDVYNNFNPQSSSQWDGLRHIAHIGSQLFYNGVKPTEVVQKGTHPDSNGRLGIHHMARRGIAGRAVLLDYARWAAEHNPNYDPFERYEITVEELEKVAAAQRVKFEEGDILLLRTGWIETHDRLGEKVKDAIKDLKHPHCAGIKACEETFRWLWDHHFAAICADNPPVEAFPPTDWATSCHSALLGGFGMPLGEMFFLEHLAEDSAKDSVYTYFFTSAPLNKENGVSSPPNAICIK
ncbi:MAG: hypothetical protein EXX96DRAFT_312599 [Benjaminiella poitrasii]|nr:MAG: hypothetical protein EXX96DRAFT_312599 [Benjaminiella poitrasii]